MLQQLILIKPGDLVLDYAGFRLNDQNLAQIEAKFNRKVKCVVRYIAQYSSFDKLVSPTEISWLHSHGIALLLVYEWSATRANAGAAAGKADGLFASSRCQELGYPVDPRLALIWAIDTNTIAGNAVAHQAYSQNFATYDEPYHGDGIYGDSDIIAWCVLMGITILNWLVGAKSWGHSLLGVHVEQVIAGSTLNYDVNNVILPFYAWLPHEETQSEEIVKQPPVILTHSEPRVFEGNLYSNSQIKWRLMEDGSKRHLLGLEYGIISTDPGVPLTNAELDTFPDYPQFQNNTAVGPTHIKLEGDLS